MDEASSRQEGRNALSERDKEAGWTKPIYCMKCGRFPVKEFGKLCDRCELYHAREEAAQLEAENDSLRQLHTAQMEENERLWAIRDSLAELLEPDEPHDLGGPHISIPWVIAKFDALKDGNPYGLIDWRKPVEGDDAD